MCESSKEISGTSIITVTAENEIPIHAGSFRIRWLWFLIVVTPILLLFHILLLIVTPHTVLIFYLYLIIFFTSILQHIEKKIILDSTNYYLFLYFISTLFDVQLSNRRVLYTRDVPMFEREARVKYSS